MSTKLLLVDDEIHIVKAAEFKFKRAGFEVHCASDGQEAWEILQEFTPDVVVTDCQMPRMNGLELSRKIRNSDPHKNLPIVMLTAKGYELSELLEQEGLLINCLMTKPFSPRELLAKVTQLAQEALATENDPSHLEANQTEQPSATAN